MEVTFSVNRYDYEGDLLDECVLLHLGKNTIIRLEKDELQDLIDRLERIKKEISGRYSI